MKREAFIKLLANNKTKAITFLVLAEAQRNEGNWDTQDVLHLQIGEAVPMCEWSSSDLIAVYDALFFDEEDEDDG